MLTATKPPAKPAPQYVPPASALPGTPISLNQLRAEGLRLINTGHTDKLKAELEKRGYRRITDVPAHAYTELYWALWNIGIARSLKGTYVGNPASVRKKSLKGKTALLRRIEDGFLHAQFDDVTTGLGYGWHRFPESHFTVTPSDGL